MTLPLFVLSTSIIAHPRAPFAEQLIWFLVCVRPLAAAASIPFGPLSL
jgi:hypothetical protein